MLIGIPKIAIAIININQLYVTAIGSSIITGVSRVSHPVVREMWWL